MKTNKSALAAETEESGKTRDAGKGRRPLRRVSLLFSEGASAEDRDGEIESGVETRAVFSLITVLLFACLRTVGTRTFLFAA